MDLFVEVVALTAALDAAAIIDRCHLEPRFGNMPLDEIAVFEVAQLRADLIGGRSQHRRNTVCDYATTPATARFHIAGAPS